MSTSRESRPLVIVESPAKAKTISQFLGDDYVVEASVGHIRDLPSKGLSIDVDSDFKTEYEINPDKRDVIKRLKALLKDADELYLATDEDREGEAIAWHLQEVLKPKIPVKRMVFHEITRSAIEHAVENSRDIDYNRVDAQETRRIVDRLYGYPVSQIMWRKVNRGLSAGRVQSPAVRLVVSRERERIAFVSADYWDLSAAFPTDPNFTAKLVALDGARVASGRDFGQDGQVTRADVAVVDEATANDLRTRLDGQPYTVRSVEEKPWRSRPKPPFMTSTLQQEGGRKLRMSANQVMRIAQGLYEKGYITYMRTDSVTLSQTALDAARAQVRELYGPEYVPDAPREYKGKSKNAQEAHEAIRPSGDTFRTPDQVSGELRKDELAVYDLIWKRTVASQMEDAVGRTISMRIVAPAPGANGSDTIECTFGASGRVITFPGYMKAYVEDRDDDGDDAADADDEERVLPPVAEGDTLPVPDLTADGHATSPPARFTEASLVKRMEELGIGRPSTYASIMTTIQDRGYVFKKGSALVPTWTAFAVVNVLERQFGEYVDYEFTAKMEDDLDRIAMGQQERIPWLHNFWFGNGRPGLSVTVDEALEKVDAAEVNTFPLGVDENGFVVVAKPGRYGPYVKRETGGDESDTASIPEGLPPDELTLEKALELLAAPKGDTPIGEDPESGLPVYVKSGRYGPYVQLGDADTLPEDTKPKMESLFKEQKPEDVTLDDALKLLSLPRVVGTDEETGLPILARNGRYGPYLSKGDEKGADARSLEAEDELFTVDMAKAKELFAQPKRRRGQAAPQPPLRELGVDPVSEQPVVVKDGRFGPYVTDGETNASLRKGDLVEEITIERAAELLQIRRETAPKKPKKSAKKKSAKKTASRKTAAKKTAAKKTAAKKKTAATKTAAAERPDVSADD